MNNNIILIGFPACYKSSVGRRLAKKLGRQFRDIDREIQNKANAAAAEIIERYGEDAFRQKEREVISELADVKDAVISCGGGSALASNFAELANSGVVVWLTASAETVFSRLNGRTRPLFDGLSVDELRQKMAERKNIYAKFADVTLSTDKRGSAAVAEELYGLLSSSHS